MPDKLAEAGNVCCVLRPMVADCSPRAVGANVTARAQLWPGASEAGQLLVWLNVVLPVMVKPLLLSVASPGCSSK